MKKLFYFFILMPVLASGQWQERQETYTPKDNVLTISHSDDKAEVLRNLKILLNDEMFSIKNYDTDIYIIETEYKPLKNVSTKLKFSVNDSLIVIRGYATNNMSFKSGMLQSGISELRNEYRNSKITVMAVGWAEMDRLAMIYKQRHNGSIKSYRE